MCVCVCVCVQPYSCQYCSRQTPKTLPKNPSLTAQAIIKMPFAFAIPPLGVEILHYMYKAQSSITRYQKRILRGKTPKRITEQKNVPCWSGVCVCVVKVASDWMSFKQQQQYSCLNA